MGAIDNFFDQILLNIKDITVEELEDFKDDLFADAKKMVEDHRQTLERYGNMLASQQISTREFESLCRQKLKRAEMTLIKQRGLAKIRVDKIRNTIIDCIFKTAAETLL